MGRTKTYGVDKVEPPGVTLESLEGDGVGVDVEGEGGLDEDVHDHETLGAEAVGENLNGVADEETGPGERVEDAKDPDEEDHGLVGAGGLLLVVERRGQSPEDESAKHAGGRSQEHGAAADLVDEHGHADGDDEGEDGLAGRETELGGGLGDTGRVVELGRVVGDDGVARPLREDTERDEDGEAVTVALGLEEVEVAAVGLGLHLEADGLLDLAELELDRGVVLVAVGVEAGEHGEGLVVPVLGDEVTGRLRHPPDEDDLDDRGEGLKEGRDAPRPLVLHEVGAEAQPADDEGADVPQAVVDRGETGTMLGVADLGEKHGRGDLGERVAESEHEAAAHEGRQVLRGTLEDGTDDHDDAADGDGELPAIVVGDEGTARNELGAGARRGQLGRATYTTGIETKLPIW